MKVLVMVPMFNCETQIPKVIQKLATLKESYKKVEVSFLFIDNKSNDNTRDSAINSTIKYDLKNYLIIENQENYGLGGSHKQAFRIFLASKNDFIIVYHGDDQVDINDLYKLIENLSLNPLQKCLLGARFMKTSSRMGYSWVRTAGNYVFNLIYSLRFGQMIYDMGSGLNCFSKSTINEFDNWDSTPDDLTFNCYFLISLLMRNEEIKFFPINWLEEDQISNARLIKQSIKTLRGLLLSTQKRRYLKQIRGRDLTQLGFTKIAEG